MSTSFRLTVAGVTAVGLMGGLAVDTAPDASATYTEEPSTAALVAPHVVPPVSRRARTAKSVLDQMTLRQKVGQLFMVGTPAVGPYGATLAHITRRHVGNIMLTGRSYGGTSVPARASRLAQARATKAATDRVRLLIATDQEGGLVQVLQGRGFSRMPTALTQGTWRPIRLRRAAGRWAHQLARAGLNMNLAPVEDTVPSRRAAASNPPIGGFDREFGFRPRIVARHGRAFAAGLSAHGVVPTIKHFPGLGRVHANTDTSTGVTDYATTRHGASITPFARSIKAGVPAVMMSTAYYHRIDPKRPAAFSPRIIHGMLRGDLGFRGVIISDDLGNARQVSPWSYGARAVKFIRAGGDMVLTVNPTTLPAMYAAVLHRAAHIRHFRHRVNVAARRILELKQHRGLL
ncbi:MAG: glycoside hydrolase family 3 protein [Nocardioides sp.]|nr:glycoside hydrolase family 3 protein [Nocardioides sp.]